MERLRIALLIIAAFIFAVALLLMNGCPESWKRDAGTNAGAASKPAKTPEPPKSALSGTIRIDGSSTVYPITAAVAEEFMDENPDVKVNVGVSGTSGGFKKFVAKETDISDASRPIKAEEMSKLAEGGLDFIEIPVAYDGLAVVVNPENDWVDYLSVEELKAIWEPESKVSKWSDVRKGFPNIPLSCYGPGTDSGTFEYFTEAIMGEARSCRQNFTPSEDDNVLVQGVAGDKGGLGYFGYAYFKENADKLKLVPVKYKNAVVAPSPETVNNGTYQPLSRPIFIYVTSSAADRPEVAAFVNYYLEHAVEIVTEVDYIPLPDDIYELGAKHFDEKIKGTMFGGRGATPGVLLKDLMSKLSKESSADGTAAANSK